MSFETWALLFISVLYFLVRAVRRTDAAKKLPGAHKLLTTELEEESLPDPLSDDHEEAIQAFNRKLGIADEDESILGEDASIYELKKRFAESVCKFALKKTYAGEMEWAENSHPNHLSGSERNNVARSFVARADLGDGGLYYVDFDAIKHSGGGYYLIRFFDAESDMSVGEKPPFQLGHSLDEAVQEYVDNKVSVSSIHQLMNKFEV